MEILFAHVGHERFTPKRNRFKYGVFYVIMPVTHTRITTPHLFSFDAFNVFSVYTKDHGPRDGSSWRVWIESQCASMGVPLQSDDRIFLIAHPRIFGYAFNPISYWLVCNAASELKAVLCEVHNTFGDDHNYILAREDGTPIVPTDRFSAEKHLYVSPFNKVPRGTYDFSFTWNSTRFASVINFYDGGTHILNTYMGGTRAPLTTRNILYALVRYPLMTLHVLVRIHYQAFKLYLKGVPHTLNDRPPHTSGKTTRGARVQEGVSPSQSSTTTSDDESSTA